LISGIPKSSKSIRKKSGKPFNEPLTLIVDAIKDALENLSARTCRDIVDAGIVLTGGGALLQNIRHSLSEKKQAYPV